jgi:hypothetical protein
VPICSAESWQKLLTMAVPAYPGMPLATPRAFRQAWRGARPRYGILSDYGLYRQRQPDYQTDIIDDAFNGAAKLALDVHRDQS